MAAVITVPVVYTNSTKTVKNVYLPTASIVFEDFTPNNLQGGAQSPYPFETAYLSGGATPILSVVKVVNSVNPMGLTYYSTTATSALLAAANA